MTTAASPAALLAVGVGGFIGYRATAQPPKPKHGPCIDSINGVCRKFGPPQGNYSP